MKTYTKPLRSKERIYHDNLQDSHKFLLQAIKMYIRDINENANKLVEFYDTDTDYLDEVLAHANELGNELYELIQRTK